MTVQELYTQWCKETKRNGGVLTSQSIKEWNNYIQENLQLLTLTPEEKYQQEVNERINDMNRKQFLNK